MKLRSLLTRYVPRHRRSRVAAAVDRLCVAYHEAFENLDYDFNRNGERRVLEVLAREVRPRTVFDVGANVGDWSAMASEALPGCAIHAFEIVPQTFATLRERLAGRPDVCIHPFGLSDAPGEVTVHYADRHTEVASCVPNASTAILGVSTAPVGGRVTTGDLFCAEHGIGRIDFLKIDVEGLEPEVLRGFEGKLAAGEITMVQFEYGYINALTKFLLKDFHDFFGRHGMKVGKLFPDHVEFGAYDTRQENFLGPNFVAVHPAHAGLLRALAG